MALLNSSRAGLRGRVLPRFPATVSGSTGVKVTKSGAAYTFGADIDSLAENTSPGSGYVMLSDGSGGLKKVSLANLPAASPAWSSIIGKPATFPPSAHTHVAADITDAGTVGKQLLQAATIGQAFTALGAAPFGQSFIGTTSAANATALLATMIGDSGSGGVAGLVPAPAAGDAAAGKFLRADGTYAVPAGGGGGGAPTTASYLTLGVDSTLTNERALALGNYLKGADGGANSSYTLSATLHPGHFWGLAIANNGTTPASKIDIAAGYARDAANANDLVLGSTLTKDLAATWAVGNAGGLDTGTKANSTTYHMHLIRKTADGSADALFSTSATSGGVTLPSGYAYGRYLWPVLTDGSGNIRRFVQNGNEFLFSNGVVADMNGAVASTAVLRTLTVPTGFKVMAIVNLMPYTTTADSRIRVSSPDELDETLFGAGSIVTNAGSTGTAQLSALMRIRTNTSAQIRTKAYATDGGCQLFINTVGWVFPRETI